jgi:hypothetical protein
MFVVGFLTPENYTKPESFNAEHNEVRFVEFSINNSKEFEMCVENAENW